MPIDSPSLNPTIPQYVRARYQFDRSIFVNNNAGGGTSAGTYGAGTFAGIKSGTPLVYDHITQTFSGGSLMANGQTIVNMLAQGFDGNTQNPVINGGASFTSNGAWSATQRPTQFNVSITPLNSLVAFNAIQVNATAAATAQLNVAGANSFFSINNQQLLKARITGWPAATGTVARGAFAAAAAGSAPLLYEQDAFQAVLNRLALLEARLGGLVNDCRTHGFINT